MEKEYLQKILIHNIKYILKFKGIKNPKEAALFLNTNYSTLRSWLAYERTPALSTLDNVCNILEVPTYILFVPDLNERELIHVLGTERKNYSITILQKNFAKLYKHKSWNEVVSQYSGLLSDETLKSYQRINNNIVPPISTLETMCSYLGIPAHELLRGDL